MQASFGPASTFLTCIVLTLQQNVAPLQVFPFRMAVTSEAVLPVAASLEKQSWVLVESPSRILDSPHTTKGTNFT